MCITFASAVLAELMPLLLFISETKITCKIANNWLTLLNFNGIFGMDTKGTRGGFLLFQSNKIDVSMRSYSINHIGVNIAWESLCWRFTGCYAPSIHEGRIFLWNLLLKLYKLRGGNSENG